MTRDYRETVNGRNSPIQLTHHRMTRNRRMQMMTQRAGNRGRPDAVCHNFVSILHPFWREGVTNFRSQSGSGFCEAALGTEERASRGN